MNIGKMSMRNINTKIYNAIFDYNIGFPLNHWDITIKDNSSRNAYYKVLIWPIADKLVCLKKVWLDDKEHTI